MMRVPSSRQRISKRPRCSISNIVQSPMPISNIAPVALGASSDQRQHCTDGGTTETACMSGTQWAISIRSLRLAIPGYAAIRTVVRSLRTSAGVQGAGKSFLSPSDGSERRWPGKIRRCLYHELSGPDRVFHIEYSPGSKLSAATRKTESSKPLRTVFWRKSLLNLPDLKNLPAPLPFPPVLKMPTTPKLLLLAMLTIMAISIKRTRSSTEPLRKH